VAVDVSLKLQRSKATQSEKINSLFAVEIITLARLHTLYITFESFLKGIEKTNFQCPNIKPNLQKLALVMGLYELNQNLFPLYESGYLKQGDGKKIFKALDKAIKDVRPQFIGLVEAFGIPDSLVPSVIGNKYGDIYEQQLDEARKSRLNRRKKPLGFENMEYIMKAKL